MSIPPHRRRSFLRRHSLSLVVFGILALWFVLYLGADPQTHIGAFYGNAIADWTGTLVIVVLTKYFYEQGSKESRKPPKGAMGSIGNFLVCHSLTIVLAVSGIAWAVLFWHSDPNSKSGQVIGNIVSEWTQVLGLVLITKYTTEIGSKEG
jgi:hypothetical protein